MTQPFGFEGNVVAPLGHEMGVYCAVHSHVSAVPLEWHHVWPLGLGGPDVEPNKVRICSNGHDAVHDYIRQLAAAKRIGLKKVPWMTRMHYGSKVRKLALKGWQAAGSPERVTGAHSRD